MSHLQKFEETKTKTYQSLQQAEKFVKELGIEQIAQDLHLTRMTLKREQFEIIVVGEFSNGKSTFLNALLQEELLPSSNVPTTALINKIYYRTQPTFEVHYDNKKSERLSKSEFLNYVADDKHKAEGKNLQLLQKVRNQFGKATHLEIGYPTPICENNIVLIDSPGTNDMDEKRVQITNEYIPKSDAAIFLLNASQVFTAREKSFLLRILDADIKKIFFVINFKDRIRTKEEFEEIQQVVLDNLPITVERPKIHFVSSLHALNHYKRLKGIEEVKSGRRALRKQQQLTIEESGMLEFEQHLMNFLLTESGTEKLRKPVERAIRLLEIVIQEHLVFERNSLNHNIENIELRVADIEMQLKKVENELNQKTKKMTQKMSLQSESISRWYADQLSHIAKVAEATMNQGILRQEDPEVIKTNIDLETGKLEKQLTEQLSIKVQNAIHSIISDEERKLNHQLGNLTQNMMSLSSNKEQWEERIVRKEIQVKKTVENASAGAVVLGGLSLFFTGGVAGWGLVSAGLAGAAYTYVTQKEDNQSMYGRLKTQVKNRYNSNVSKQTKELEKSLKELNNHLKEEYQKLVQGKIAQERNRSQMLINNQNLAADEVQQKLASLDHKRNSCEMLINKLEHDFNQYCHYVKTEEKLYERLSIPQ
ncbi:dynamin family protein [Ureibacillus xyleni]|uniref:Dynamin family protein n=1 Tax=Ureibacillus xyleni TaxID=614648 RepID=A0A285TN38_9BACL|nr:dynamin family protein [Ureibacillus xyleni]SOC23905.1 dynamin family protein [Ureibacillus xyleni]